MSPKGKQLTLSDRIAIETGLMAQDPLKKIAAILGKHPTTISQEIKNNRTFVIETYSYGNDCRYAKNCGKHNVCGNTECTGDCVRCKSSNCHEFCDKYVSSKDFMQQEFRKGRSYEDFEHFIEKYPNIPVTEMDTVKGKRQKGKCLLTMIFRDNSVMLLFLLPDCKAESVKRIFDYLEAGL